MVIVADSFDDYAEKISETYQTLVTNGVITPAPEVEAPTVPEDFTKALKSGLVRRPAGFVSSISDDRGEELMYGHMPTSKAFRQKAAVGYLLPLTMLSSLLAKVK